MNKSSPIVTIIGHVCIDQNTVDGLSSEKWGSSPMYIANYLQEKYAIQPSIFAPYGSDFSQYKNGFHFINEASAFNTLIYKNIVTNGSRTQRCYNAASYAQPAITQEIIDTLTRTDIIIVTPMTPYLSTEYVTQILGYLPKKSLKVLLPQGYMRTIHDDGIVSKRAFNEAAQLLSKFDLLIASDEDISDALERAKGWTTKNHNLSVVITQAENGASLFARGEQTSVPTTPIPFTKIKNPVGSGDSFSAQLSLSLYEGLGAVQSIEVANKTTGLALLSSK